MGATPTKGELMSYAQATYDCHRLLMDLLSHLRSVSYEVDDPLFVVGEMFSTRAEERYEMYWKVINMTEEEGINFMKEHDHFVSSMKNSREEDK